MMSIRNECGKAVLMWLIPILVGVIYDSIICPKTPLRCLASINEVKEVRIHMKFDIDHHYQEFPERGK